MWCPQMRSAKCFTYSKSKFIWAFSFRGTWIRLVVKRGANHFSPRDAGPAFTETKALWLSISMN